MAFNITSISSRIGHIGQFDHTDHISHGTVTTETKSTDSTDSTDTDTDSTSTDGSNGDADTDSTDGSNGDTDTDSTSTDGSNGDGDGGASFGTFNSISKERLKTFTISRQLIPYDKTTHTHRAVYFAGHNKNRMLTLFYGCVKSGKWEVGGGHALIDNGGIVLAIPFRAPTTGGYEVI